MWKKIAGMVDENERVVCPFPLVGEEDVDWFRSGMNWYQWTLGDMLRPEDVKKRSVRQKIVDDLTPSDTKGETVVLFMYNGWVTGSGGPDPDDPWRSVRNELFKDRWSPMGFYDESDQRVIDNILRWLYEYGVDVIAPVVFPKSNGSGGYIFPMEHFVKGYLKSTEPHKPKIMLVIDHKTSAPAFQYLPPNPDAATIASTSATNRPRLVAFSKHWIHGPADGQPDGLAITSRPDYFKIDGKPVMMFADSHHIMDGCFGSAANVKSALAAVDAVEHARNGNGGIYWVAGIATPTNHWLAHSNKASAGYSAISAYNVFRRITSEGTGLGAFSPTDYAGLANVYCGPADDTFGGISWWERCLSGYADNVFLPCTSGFGPVAWGGRIPDNLRGSSPNMRPTPAEFRGHLMDARVKINHPTQGPKTRKVVMINNYCEYGEGSWVAPSVTQGFDMLQMIFEVFGK